MKRFALPAIAILLLAGCAGQPLPDELPPGSPPMFSEPADGESAAIGLVNLWRVTGAEGEGDATWLRLDGGEFQLWRDCGMVIGSWRATDSLFLASAHGASGECATDVMPTIEWLDDVTGFVATTAGYELVSGSGEVVASLSIDGAPEPIESAAEFFTEPPELTEDVRALFRRAAPLPDGLTAAGDDALLGRWLPAELTATTDPHVVFEADGTWSGSDGCNGGGGRWAVDKSGEFLATSGPSTLIYCEGAPVPSWVAQATTAGVDADGSLVLFDASGTELGRMVR